jgi:2-oxoglutarate ferredoxin oxidoreductase subunit beta
MSQENTQIIEELVAGPPSLALGPPYVACSGCQHPTIGRIVVEVLEELGIDDKSIGLIGVGCAAIWMFSMNIDVLMVPHGRCMDAGAAIRHSLPDRIVFSVQGDGDTLAIGAESFLARLGRGERMTTIMCNNTNYGTTGGQMAPTTLLGQKTKTTPTGRDHDHGGFPINGAELAATLRGVNYSARGSLHSPAQYQKTKKYVKRAFENQMYHDGYSFVEIITACPVNWHMKPVECQKWIEKEVITQFPLGEFKNVDHVE